MLNLTASTLHRSYECPIAPGANLSATGCVLVQGEVAGSVKPSTGAQGEVFVGFAAAQQMTLFSTPAVENHLVPASGKVLVNHVPESGTIFCALKASLTASGDSKREIDLGQDQAGKVATISYRYVPTTVEARFLQGDGPAGGAAALSLGTVTTVMAGTVYTSEFDTTVDWNNLKGKVIGAGADGRVTAGEASAIKVPIPNARVVHAPASGAAELGLYFSA